MNFQQKIIDEMTKAGSDKVYHQYDIAYNHFLQDRKIKNFLEIGIANASKNQSSIHAWKNIFPEAKIFGMDVMISKMIDNEDGIETFWGNQSNVEDLQKFVDFTKTKFDVILDDGSHRFSDAIVSFEFLFDYLEDGGIYLIEDIVKNSKRNTDIQKLFEWQWYLMKKNNIQYDIIDCHPELDDDSVVIGIWRKQ